jgi:predicted transcriptional regulator
MNTVTLEVRSLTDSLTDFSQAWKSGQGSDARISFASVDLLRKVLSANRLAILKAMTGAGPLALREIARRVERDVKALRADVQALLNAGLIQRSGDGLLHSYDGAHMDFVLKLT